MIKLCHINITTITKHKDELLARYSYCDIISINETNLRIDNTLDIRGYNIYRNDRAGRRGGGVLLAVKDYIKCREIYNKTIEQNEIIAVEIQTNEFKSMLIASIYVPPSAKLQPNVFHELYQMNNNCIIMGDLNATLIQMGSRKTNTKGRQLQEVINEGFLHCIDDDSTTYEKDDYEEKLDWILASQPLHSFISNVETHPSFGAVSGHKPLTFTIPVGVEAKPPSPRTSYNFKAAEWNKYRQTLDEQLKQWNEIPISNAADDIETYSEFITQCITAATVQAIPTTRQISTHYIASETTKRLIKQKHQAYRHWKKTAHTADKQQYYKAKVLLVNSIRNDKKNNFNKLMSSLCQRKMYSDAVWHTVRKFHNKRIKQSYPSIMKYNNTSAATDNEKANLFADYFQNEVYCNSPDTLPFHEQITRQSTIVKNGMHRRSNKNKTQEITTKEVKLIIKHLPNSSNGPDNIHNRCLKNHTDLLLQHLTRLFNVILDFGYIPNMWKKANIILLLKPKKDKQQPSSYRPISLLSCLGKLLEKIVKQRLTLEVERRNILPAHQAGFRSKKSTLYNIIRLERYAHEQLHGSQGRRHSGVIFFDIKAAFDSVWHDGLIYKLNDLRLPRYLLRYLVSFLYNRTATIEIENTLSRSFKLNSGTPQGSPLSPLLYIIYTADSMTGIPQHTENGLFADDTALWTSSNTIASLSLRLQQSIDAFGSWCKSWKLKIQPTKTEMIHFSIHPRKKYKHPVAVKVEDTIIQPVDAARYLGVIIDKQLKWRNHLQHIESKVIARISLLRYLSKAANESNPKTMINIYKSIIRTVLLYGYPVLLTGNDKLWERLQIIQNRAIRAALNLPIYTSVEYIHRISKLPKLKQYATSLLTKSIQKSTLNNDITLTKHLEDILNPLRTTQT
jgi:hypothetical protein